RVVIVGDEAIEGAASLGLEGKKVTMVQGGESYSWPPYVMGGAARREPLARFLKKGKVDAKFNASVKDVQKDVVVLDVAGNEEKVEYDTLVVAVGRTRVNDLFTAFKGKNRELYVIGDAKEVRNMTPSSHEGYWVGRTI
ncbi:MAG: hypothetical protein EOM62_18185, partial [Bacteroidia bacterium]|nr:hypothetical protein [Bacteroidia bacterium]